MILAIPKITLTHAQGNLTSDTWGNSSTSMTDIVNEILSGAGSVDGMIGETVNILNDSNDIPLDSSHERSSDSIFGRFQDFATQTNLSTEESEITSNYSVPEKIQTSNETITESIK